MITKLLKHNKILTINVFLFLLLTPSYSFAQEKIRILAYNLQDYAANNNRDADFRTVLNGIIPSPDILIGIELISEARANIFLDNVLNFGGSTIYSMGTFLLNNNGVVDNNVIYYKNSKFSFLSSDLVVPPTYGNHPTYKFQLQHAATQDKIIVYGVHFTSGGSQSDRDQRNLEAQTIRNETINFTNGEFFIVAGDFNWRSGLSEQAYITLTEIASSGYLIDPENGSESQALWTKDIQSIFDSRYDLVLNSQSVVDAGGVKYEPGTFTVDGNDGTGLKGNVPQVFKNVSNHLPVYADFYFSSPAPGSIVFTQVGATDNDVIEFMTLYDKMDLTKLKITNSAVNSSKDGFIGGTGNGTFDLSDTPWKDIPGGTFVRLGPSTSGNDDDPTDRIIQYDGSGTNSTVPNLSNGSVGDQLIAYTGLSASPYFIAGITWGNDGWTTLPGSSFAPGTPSDISLGNFDNYYFNGSVDGDADVTRTAITTGVWNGSDTRFGYQDLKNYIGNSALPVELSFFTAMLNGNNVELRWRTETEINNYGFDIERAKDNSDWLMIGFVEGNGNSNSPKQYSFSDNDLNLSGEYYYRLKQIDNNGTYEYSDVVSVEVGVPNNFYLSQNYPNPFNPETRIDFTLPEKQLISLRIYNMLGELVGELVNEEREAGSYSVIFDASKLPSGVYIYRLQASEFADSKKMTLLK